MLPRSWRRTVLVLVAVVLGTAVATTPTFTSAAASAKYAPPPLPAFERLFAQQFRVSVMTQSYGVFNATLRMRGSMNFPERVHGELIPVGEPRLNHHTQTLLPHFKRVRSVEDERLSDLPFTVSSKQNTAMPASGELATAGEEERPSLLVVDLQLLHTDSARGKAQVYYLPAELKALQSKREAMDESATVPTATADFTFRLEVPHMTNTPLSDTPALARVSAATIATGSQSTMERVTTGEAAAATNGEVIFRWITEHEFSATFSIPMKSGSDEDGGVAATKAHLERVWVYGYVTPSKMMFDRKQRQAPWYQKYLMLGVGLMGFVVQIISGWTEGKTKAVKAAEEKQHHKSKKQAELEAQERLRKKK